MKIEDNNQENLTVTEELNEDIDVNEGESLEERNISKILEIAKTYQDSDAAVLIEEVRHGMGRRDYRFFYDPTEKAFIIGPEAKIEGFELPSGEILTKDNGEDDIRSRSFLDNVVTLYSDMFENEESWAGYAQNLWLACKLYAMLSDDLDPSYSMYLSIKEMLLINEDPVVDFLTFNDVEVEQADGTSINLVDSKIRYVRESDVLQGVVGDEVIIESHIGSKKIVEDLGIDALMSITSSHLSNTEAAIVHHFKSIQEKAEIEQATAE